MDEPERADPKRGDWLANVWGYIRSVEQRVHDLETKVAKLERDFQRSDSKPIRITQAGYQRPLDED